MPDKPDLPELKRKKLDLENRLTALGINDYKVSHLPYLDHSNVTFQTPYDTACRLLIVYGIAYIVHHMDDRPKMISWFKQENLWDKVSEKEKTFLVDPSPGERELMNLSWGLEGALTLGWVLGLSNTLHNIDQEETDEEMETFINSIPELGGETTQFLKNVQYRDLGEIYQENLVNEMATAYFRDLLFNGKKDETSINRMVSFERHKVLNWVRQFSGITDWDETDTST